MTPSDRTVVEAILLVADEPVPARLIGEVLERPRSAIEDLLADLSDSYREEERGWVLREVAGGWRLYTDPECAPWLERFVSRGRAGRLTGAALEVLAIVAYKQPISRTQIAELRGVDSDGVVKTLLGRGLIEPAGRDHAPGAPVLFKVSGEFLEKMGLRSVADLPPLAGFMPDADAVEDMEAKLAPDL